MANSLTITPATGTLMPSSSNKTKTTSLRCVPSPRFLTVSACCGDSVTFSHCSKLAYRRGVSLGLVGAMVGLKIGLGGESANAAARRRPPPPAEEKTDPNVSGVQAKVLASKRRKEAMKEEMAKLREKGKIIAEPTIENKD